MVKRRVMVVDDSRVIHAEMEKMLKDSAFEIVAHCRNGEEALEQYETVKPDLVTMDVIMPGTDGLEICRQMNEKWPDCNVLMASSMAYDDIIKNAVAMGARGFLVKPFTKESLLEGLHSVCQAIDKEGAEHEGA